MIVTFFGSVLECTNDEESIETGPCHSLRELSDVLVGRYGEPFNELLIKGECFFLVNGKGVMKSGGLDTLLDSGDRIDILPFVDAG